ncbi:MAG: PAS domain-containing protein, partial [Bacteroidales bacterium]|nr:PAS domain-containing protein [Bacteroidales bacterium]
IISGVIGLIITVILLTISRQSHRIEVKRKMAEEELKKSRELYRTLAEAASEGVLIWSSQGIRANKTLLSWTGHSEEDLLKINIEQLFKCNITKEYDNPGILYSELNSRLFCEGLLKTFGGALIKSHADFSRILLGDQKAVLIVIRPSKDVMPVSGFSPEKRLLNNISTGFFRVTFGRRNKFISATDRTIKMLGFHDLEELIPSNIEDIFAFPDNLNDIRVSLAANKDICGRQVLLRRKNGEEFRALLSIVVVDSDSQGIWCEGSVEELAVSASHDIPYFPDLSAYSTSYLSQAPVTLIMKPATTQPWDSSAESCLSLMRNKSIEVLIITGKDNLPVGMLYLSDTAVKMTEGNSREITASDLMHSPPLLISKDSKVAEAIKLISGKPAKAVAVSSSDNLILGIISPAELISSLSNLPEIILSSIQKASSGDELQECYTRCRILAVSMIMGHADPYALSLYLATVADAISTRAVELCLSETGDPPCRFAFIHTGSAGRREQTLLTDQDNAIIFEDVHDEVFDETWRFFISLGEKINKVLDIAGYRLCTGGNMAGNPEWCQPLAAWKRYFTRWINEPGPDEILKTSVFFDFRYCYGDRQLVEDLRSHIRNNLATSDIYFHHVALAWKQFSPSASTVAQGKVNIKKLLMPLTGFVRLYALKNALTVLSTPDRILELYSTQHFDVNLLREVLKAWRDLTMIRFYQQASSISRGIEPDNIIDLNIAEHDFNSFVQNAVFAINDLMLKAGTDFYTDII